MKFKSVLTKLGFLLVQVPVLLALFAVVMERKEYYETLFRQDPVLQDLYLQLKRIYEEMKKK